MSRLGPGAEFDLIRRIAETLGPRAAELGDDCVTIPCGDGYLALSTDTSVEAVHFRREWLTPEEIGWRAAVGALSDLAAAAAEPVGALVAFTVPPTLGEDHVVAVMTGVGDAVTECGGQVLGGDLSRGTEVQLTITVVGRVERVPGRGGARPGDGVWVTGALGGARAAVEAWRAGDEPLPAARAAFARPHPRIAVGRWLAGAGARAMLDLSDGLAGDAGHLAAASGVAVTIELERLPVHPGVPRTGGRATELVAAEGGEDYELLAAMPAEFHDEDAARCLAETGIPMTRIGTVETGAGARLLHHGSGMTLRGYDHFR